MRQLYEQKSQHHWQMLITDNKGDAKKLWRTFDSILRTSKRTMTTKSSIHTADQLVVSVAQLVARRTHDRKVVGSIPTNAVCSTVVR